MSPAVLLSMFGDIPKDSAAGAALASFVGALVVDAKSNGAVGSSFKLAIDACRKGDDSLYRELSATDKAVVLNTLNALKGALE